MINKINNPLYVNNYLQLLPMIAAFKWEVAFLPEKHPLCLDAPRSCYVNRMAL